MSALNTDALAAIELLEQNLRGKVVLDRDEVRDAIDDLLEVFDLSRSCGHCDDNKAQADDRSEIETAEIEEALSRARRGEIGDCIIHLGRALPPEFAGIADVLERAFGDRR